MSVHRFEADVEVLGRQVDAKPIIRRYSFLSHPLMPQNEDSQREEAAFVHGGLSYLVHDIVLSAVTAPIHMGGPIHDPFAAPAARRDEQEGEAEPIHLVGWSHLHAAENVEPGFDLPRA